MLFADLLDFVQSLDSSLISIGPVVLGSGSVQDFQFEDLEEYGTSLLRRIDCFLGPMDSTESVHFYRRSSAFY